MRNPFAGVAPVDWLVVGLGNPGPRYANSPHNVGFGVARALVDRWGLGKPRKKFAGELAEGRTSTGGPRVAVLLPQTYMNESGRSVGPARGAYKLDLGSPDFHRVRVGVGRPDTTDPEIVSAHVLGTWKQPRTEVEQLISRAADEVERLIS